MLTRAQVSTFVGRTVYARGEQVLEAERVVSVARNGAKVVGHVLGTRDENYVVTITMSSASPDARPTLGRCTCPVRLACKHCAATLLALVERDERAARTSLAPAPRTEPRRAKDYTRTPEWQRTFEGMLTDAGLDTLEVDDAPAPVTEAPAEVALMVEVLASQRRDGGVPESVTLRPLVRGRTGAWVRQGVSWTDFRHGFPPVALPTPQLAALRALGALGETDARHSSAMGVYLDTLPGPALWAALRDAHALGVPFLHPDRAPVPFDEQPALVVLHLDRVRGGSLRVRVTIEPDGGWDGHDVQLPLGSPAAGVLARTGGERPARDDRLRLAVFTRALDATVRDLLERPEPLAVPAADVPLFLGRVLPGLRGRVDEVRASGVDLPEAPAPTLVCDVEHRGGHEVVLRWEWRYLSPGLEADGVPALTVPLGTPSRSPLRDREAERALLARVRPHVTALDAALRAHEAAGGDLARDPEAGPVGARVVHGIEAARLLTAEIPRLRELADEVEGFAVDEHGRTVTYHLEDDVRVALSTSARDGDRDWFDLAVTVEVGGRTVPYEQVFRAIAAGDDYLLLDDGTYFALDDPRFARLRELIAEARAMQDTRGGGLRVSRYQSGLFDDLEGLDVDGVQATAWRSSLAALADGARPEPVGPPAGLRAELRPYQQEGVDWLCFLERHGLGGVLADDMGLGKTVQALAFALHVLRRATPSGERPAPMLVVAPTSVVGNWAAEVARFTDLRCAVVGRTSSGRGTPLGAEIGDAEIVVTSYAVLRLDTEAFAERSWSALVLDEAQFVKNHKSVGYRAVREIDAPTKIALTGTPLENNLMELWSILSIVCPGLLGHPGRFAEFYQKPVERDGDSERLALLRRRVAPFMVRRTKESVASDLPEKVEQVLDVELLPRHRAVYDRLLARERARVLGLVENLDGHRFEVLRSLTVLRQAALDVSLVGADDPATTATPPGGTSRPVPSSKLEVLFEMLEDILAEGHSVLIFSQFTQFLGRVRDGLEARSVAHSYLDGRTRRRQEQIDAFTRGETQVFLISLKAGGFGLNLTAADYCILLDPWWNPAAEAQAVDRAHRIGQTKQVMVYRMVASDTIEEKVMRLKEGKSALFSSVLDGGAAGGAGLSAADVRELLS